MRDQDNIRTKIEIEDAAKEKLLIKTKATFDKLKLDKKIEKTDKKIQKVVFDTQTLVSVYPLSSSFNVMTLEARRMCCAGITLTNIFCRRKRRPSKLRRQRRPRFSYSRLTNRRNRWPRYSWRPKRTRIGRPSMRRRLLQRSSC